MAFLINQNLKDFEEEKPIASQSPSKRVDKDEKSSLDEEVNYMDEREMSGNIPDIHDIMRAHNQAVARKVAGGESHAQAVIELAQLVADAPEETFTIYQAEGEKLAL